MTTTPVPLLDVTPPPELTVPLELVELPDDVELLVVAATADEVPGTVEALTAAKTPRAANEAMATPDVSWLISR